MEGLPANSVDYIFTDPSYGIRSSVGELNCVWEAWLGVKADWYEDEIIVDVRGKSEVDWASEDDAMRWPNATGVEARPVAESVLP